MCRPFRGRRGENVHLESRTVVLIETLQRFNEEEGSGEPNRSSPIPVSIDASVIN